MNRLFHLFRIPFFDLIIIEYELFPYLPGVIERFLTITGKKYILDYDDAVFHSYDKNPSNLIRFFLSGKIPGIIRGANSVITANDYLADFAKNYHKKVFKIPTCVSSIEYSKVKPPKPEKRFTIGWIGSTTTSIYLIRFANILRRLTDIDYELKCIGFDKRYLGELNGIPFKYIEWSFETEIREIKTFSVGIMPLDDTPWSRGKSGFKIIQYMASSIPVIASNVGENTRIIKHGESGFLANTEEDWINYFRTLYNDLELRNMLGNNGFRIFNEKFSTEINSKLYLKVLKSTIS